MSNVLITGFPSFTAHLLAEKLISNGDHVQLLVRPRFRAEAESFLKRLPSVGSSEVLLGDVMLMDLGLNGPQVRRIMREVEHIYHLATVYPLSKRSHDAHQVNVDGTRCVLDLALSADRLTRFNFYSTAFVSGTREGVVLEDDLDHGQRFRNGFEETKFEAEKLVRRAGQDIPVSIYRPSLVVCNTDTGQMDPANEAYRLLRAFLRMPMDIHIPLPGRGDYPLNLVPVDYVCDAMYAISRDPRGAGRTFHLTDPNPLPTRLVLEIIADQSQRKRPRGAIPARIARHLLKLPGMGNLGSARDVVDRFNQVVIYNTMNTTELLSTRGIVCPPFQSYANAMISYLQQQEIPAGNELYSDPL
jgi:thioester reductase-like protein